MKDETLFSQLFLSIAQIFHEGVNLKDLDITGLNLMILMTVYKKPGITMSELARTAGISRAQLSRMIAKLETEGLIQRVHNEENRRVVNVQRTKKGDVLVQKQIQIGIDFVQSRLAKLDTVDQAAFLAHLKEIHRLLHKVELLPDGSNQFGSKSN